MSHKTLYKYKHLCCHLLDDKTLNIILENKQEKFIECIRVSHYRRTL